MMLLNAPRFSFCIEFMAVLRIIPGWLRNIVELCETLSESVAEISIFNFQTHMDDPLGQKILIFHGFVKTLRKTGRWWEMQHRRSNKKI